MPMATTQAKTGRSRKNLAIVSSPTLPAPRVGCRRFWVRSRPVRRKGQHGPKRRGGAVSLPSTITRSPGLNPLVTSHLSPMARSSSSARCSTLLSSSTTRAMGFPFGSRDHPLLGNEKSLLIHPLFYDRTHEHAREKDLLGIGEDQPQRDRTRRRVHRDITELQRALQRVRRSVFEKQPDLPLARRRRA